MHSQRTVTSWRTLVAWTATVSFAIPLAIACSSGKRLQDCTADESCTTSGSGTTGGGSGYGTGTEITYSPYDVDTTNLVEGQDYVRGTVKDGNGNDIPIVALTARRCEQLGDSLSPQQAKGRIAYAIGPMPHGSASAGCDTDSINFVFTKQAEAGAYIQANGGVTSLYPTYGETNASGQPYIANPPGPAPISGHDCSNIHRTGRRLLAYCIPSCFAPDQRIRMSESGEASDTKSVTVVEAFDTLEERKRLDPNATLAVETVKRAHGPGNLELTLNPAVEIITELDVAAEYRHPVDVVEFRTRSQSSGDVAALVVTPNHPVVVLREDGAYLIPAAAATADERLLLASGDGEAIVSMTKKKIDAKVYSVRMRDSLDINANANLIVGGGALDFITGSFGYQQLLGNRGIDASDYVLNNLNRLVLRNSGIPDNLIAP